MFETEGTKYGNETRLPPICHAYETFVSIDEDNFETIQPGLLFIKDFDKVPSKLDVMLINQKIPFIAFIDQFSVVATYKESGGYEFLEEWNGIYGIDCFISFEEKKPKFGDEAMEAILTKNTFVVFDLIKIMSMPSDDI
uniref:Uncharacterized protein n=1 Tax=Panagrolaimus sp. ES5 TaxID=591445 RepID=A0AC34G551_9BILA